MSTIDPIRALLDEVADMAEAHVSPYPGHATAWGEFLDRIGTALSQPPEPAEGPSDEELPLWTEGICGDGAAILRDGAMVPVEDVVSELNRGEFARFALKRRTPRPAPIPVSERLPGPGDCAPWPDDSAAVPWCWAAKELDGGWEWTQLSMLGLGTDTLGRIIAGGGWTHWLPWWALPLPAPPIAAELGEAQP